MPPRPIIGELQAIISPRERKQVRGKAILHYEAGTVLIGAVHSLELALIRAIRVKMFPPPSGALPVQAPSAKLLPIMFPRHMTVGREV
jgi:hypothetical protein